MKLKFPAILALPAIALLFACSPNKPAAAPQPSASPQASASAAPSVTSSSEAPVAADTAAHRAGQRMQKMVAELNLTPDQQEKLKAVFESQRPAMQAIRDDQSMTPEQKRAKFREMAQGMESQLSTILTPEQKAKWDEAREKMRQEMRERRAQRENGESAAAASPAASSSPAASAPAASTTP